MPCATAGYRRPSSGGSAPHLRASIPCSARDGACKRTNIAQHSHMHAPQTHRRGGEQYRNAHATNIGYTHTHAQTLTTPCTHSLDEATALNTVVAFPALFVVYDLFYSMWHRLLHLRQFYKFIHKHHHHQVPAHLSPTPNNESYHAHACFMSLLPSLSLFFSLSLSLSLSTSLSLPPSLYFSLLLSLFPPFSLSHSPKHKRHQREET